MGAVVVNAPLGSIPAARGPPIQVLKQRRQSRQHECAAWRLGAMLLHRHFVRDIVGSQALLSLSRAALWRSAYLFSP
jgi:hypothetical protein